MAFPGPHWQCFFDNILLIVCLEAFEIYGRLPMDTASDKLRFHRRKRWYSMAW